jgi:hypothetical protein
MFDSLKELPDRAKNFLAATVVGVLLLGLGITSLAVALFWRPPQTQSVLHEFFVALWPFFLTVALAILVYEKWLRQSFISELKRLSGPQIIKALRPREALHALLEDVYGNNNHGANRDVVVSVLGGRGEAADRRDLTVSDSTRVDITLADHADASKYDLTFSVSYHLARRESPDTPFVFFITTDAHLRDLILLGCDQPLFDFWYVPDASPDLDLATLTKLVSVQVDYDDPGGEPHTSPPFSPIAMTPIPQDDWWRYLRFFREDIGNERVLNPCDYKSTLAVMTFSFRQVLDEERFHCDFVRGFKLASTTTQQKSTGYCYWVAQYPCLVEVIKFDTSGFTLPGVQRSRPEFHMVPFLIRADTKENTSPPLTLAPHTWLLPGHGVSLLWKLASSDALTATEADAK